MLNQSCSRSAAICIRSVTLFLAVSLLALVGAASAQTTVFQADIEGAAGNFVVQNAWTGFDTTGMTTISGNPPNPGVASTTINSIGITLTSLGGNTGARTRGLPTAITAASEDLSKMFQADEFAASGFDVLLMNLIPGTQYTVDMFGYDAGGGNLASIHYGYSLAGDGSNLVDAGWLTQPSGTVFTPAPNTGLALANAGTGWLETTFTATGTSVDFKTMGSSGSNGVAALNGIRLIAADSVAVPEPSTLMLMFSALAGAALFGKRRMQRRKTSATQQ